jgi:hypothetical protein
VDGGGRIVEPALRQPEQRQARLRGVPAAARLAVARLGSGELAA